MNDFTKEELKIIEKSLSAYVCEFEQFKTYSMIKNKIQSMIDNYCEHTKEVFPVYTASGDLPVAGFCYQCGHPVDGRFIDE
jgi:hypothetical protein